MKIVIFAGGTGRRLWPISRQASPKQFEPILGDKSTLQLAVERVAGPYGPENIFISTNSRYQDLIRQQLPQLPPQNIIGEPVRRDLAPAVGLALAHLAHSTNSDDEPVTILWGDNYMSDVSTFVDLLAAAERLLADGEAQMLFIGETPRFANENLGWIGHAEERGRYNGIPYYGFRDWHYRPSLERAEEMLRGGKHVWNTGYFVTTLGFVRGLYETYQPEMAKGLEKIEQAIGTDSYQVTLNTVYPQLEEVSFDDAILTHVSREQALVLHGEMGWSDPGTLYALKEALVRSPDENATRGMVRAPETKDSLLLNYESDKLMAVIGLDGVIVVNMEDAVLVVRKEHIADVKRFVNELVGTELEKYS